jgi:hypothetical protein
MAVLLPPECHRTEAQFRGLLKAAGFEVKSITPATSMISVVEGKPV